MSAADSNTSLPEKKSGHTFGHNETLLLISLYQKYEVFFSDFSYKKKAGPGPHISTGVFLCRQSELFQAFRTNHSYSVPTILIPELWIKKRALRFAILDFLMFSKGVGIERGFRSVLTKNKGNFLKYLSIHGRAPTFSTRLVLKMDYFQKFLRFWLWD